MAIQNPNFCGQGFDPDHTNNRWHELLLANCYQYSHSTKITRYDGTSYVHHTYKSTIDPDFSCGIGEHYGALRLSFSMGGSSHRHNVPIGSSWAQVLAYVKRKNCKLRKQIIVDCGSKLAKSPNS